MIDYDEVMEEINRLEQDETTYHNCSKLAVLYSIKDHKKEEKPLYQKEYSYASSEFMSIAQRTSIDRVLNVLDEHLEAVKLLYPKEYSAIMRKLKEESL